MNRWVVGRRGEALADDAAVVVVLGVGHGGQAAACVGDGAARGVGELLEGDGVSVGEQPQQRDQQGGVEAGLVRVGEPVGQVSEVRHLVGLPFVVGGSGAQAQQDSFEMSVVKALATIRIPSAIVR